MKKEPSSASEIQSQALSDPSAGEDPLKILNVIDELRVGRAKIEKNRLTVPYTVVQEGKEDAIDLVYSYEEDVFKPGDEADENLANMIGAQLALNYGLFCTRIVFEGDLDAADAKFISDVVENTAREIYVKKFLEPNAYLLGRAARVPVARLARYSRAELAFPRRETVPNRIAWSPQESREERIAILSSGGKDSLLSFGLLNEIGMEVHPIFGNESGRHWFTALNAYRYFERHVPRTARVWMNTDRIFAWMLRHMPFIRQDFANVRSDEYPIRLWTVALFLFGSLPLLRKRGVGRLVLGDEYDTTFRMSFRGILHYDGLYDQSRYFDNAMTRYFASKRWRLSQFSVLRPLSEFLIEGILVNRYPHLFEHQVSCHATHTAGSRVRPCGKCEKCRRIVGMVLANGGDPAVCGYTPDQVKECLSALNSGSLHQERAASQHLLWTLQQKGLLQIPESRKGSAKERPEIAKVRFEPERSPMDAVPRDLRVPLYKIFLQHAAGAARRSGRVWVDIDLLSDPELHSPYPFERTRPQSGQSPGPGVSKSTFTLGEMTWPDAKKRFKEVDVALLPVGAIEQHGPHLPLDTDSFDADYLARAVAGRCTDPKPIVFPLIPYGVSYHHDDFAGTISIRNRTLADMVYEIGMSAARHGITKLVIINGHGGNDPALHFAAQEISRDARVFVCVDSGETSDVDIYSMVDTPNDVHAGEIETSTSLATRPDLVRMDKAEPLVPEFSNRYLDLTAKRGISWYAYTKKISKSGVLGDPRKGTAEKGRKMWEVMIANLVAFVEDLKQLTLDEVFQKRY
jgi:creatinine amidohydrolase/Fe(II)-dependent formamide hydrolase-like protein